MGLKEKCGVFGVYSNRDDAAELTYLGLWTLQHRGQESSGIVSSAGRGFKIHKNVGLVAQVYRKKDIEGLKGNIAIGHNRYSTFGKNQEDHTQPVLFARRSHVALAHNGNLPKVDRLRKFLTSAGILVKGLNDSELMCKALEYHMVKGKSLQEAIIASHKMFTGAYSLLVMSKNQLAVVRDPCGIRPLSFGKINGSYVFSSETCAFKAVGADYIRDVQPGEMVIVDKSGLSSYKLADGETKIDAFEFIYFARPDSILLGKSVYEVRKRLGVRLAKEHVLKADIVVPIPDSAIPAAIGYSQESGIPIEHALVKNRYIHRTFIKPSQRQRDNDITLKLNVITEIVAGKDVILIDDSIVRGSTAKKLVQLLKASGARKVFFLISSPPVKFPDFYGIDTPKQQDLIASHMTPQEISKFIGADGVGFLSFGGMLKAIGLDKGLLCTSCFSGEYPIDIGTNKTKIVYTS